MSNSFALDDFREHFEALDLEHFAPDEFLRGMNYVRNGVSNSPPPRKLWDNFVPTAFLLDVLRRVIGTPIVPTSVYRAPDYNSQLRGAAPYSTHKGFMACDFVLPQGEIEVPTSGEWCDSEAETETLRGPAMYRRVADLLRSFREHRFDVPVEFERVDPGGEICPFYELQTYNIADGGRGFRFHGGIHAYQTFVHLDTRGVDAEW